MVIYKAPGRMHINSKSLPPIQGIQDLPLAPIQGIQDSIAIFDWHNGSRRLISARLVITLQGFGECSSFFLVFLGLVPQGRIRNGIPQLHQD